MSDSKGPLFVDVVVVSCPCGLYPLDKSVHATSALAWQAAADHVALNPDKCHPSMTRDVVPVGLAPPKRRTVAETAREFNHAVARGARIRITVPPLDDTRAARVAEVFAAGEWPEF